MIEAQKYEKLFSSPFFSFQVDGHEALNTELLAFGQALERQNKGSAKSNRGGWHSKGNLFDEEAPCISLLSVLCETAVKQATRRIGGTDPDQLDLKLFAWMNRNPTGAFNAPHTHPGAHWSGVYYVAQPKVDDPDSGRIEFLDPRSDLPNWRLLNAKAFKVKKSLKPKPGEMILFPSYLMHWVFPNSSAEDRVSIAFNATFSAREKS
ncbi:TIGR02466 family protein [Aliiroseovarius crassostreae]|uniref:TIGR02466 family protein n=1 Tax=Aliiroseovarius crassostreae TaxID=154981 RepID=UPI00220B7F91|nr:TIGR02466 family protein [Aliiroseovarius crassostreae]UWP88301.1 hypothetical protein K3J57_10345 [Aliiroseovarius crassostreae]UWQ00960.1 hypothetical protein K3X44_10660 [Aliiroseovarius crassostreae]